MYPPPFEGTADAATVDKLLRALASDPRRLVLGYFEHAAVDTASLDDLVEYLAERGDEPSPDQVRVRLHHVHLPRLEAVDLVDYTRASRNVHSRGPPAAVEADAWSAYLTRMGAA